MLARTRGIVLGNTVFGEADLIITCFTEDLGLVKAFAKSPRKTGSRFGSSLEPFSFVRISLFGKEGSGLLRITGSDIIESFQYIREDLRKVSALAPALKLTERLLPEREPDRKSFSLLLFTLRHGRNMEPEVFLILSLFYIVRFLHIHGFSPKLDRCAGCHSNTATYHVSHGSLYCSECATAEVRNTVPASDIRKISEGTKKLYNALLTWDIKSILRIKISERILNELTALIEEHIRYHVIQKELPPLFHPPVFQTSQVVL
ncbi:MAG: DNA repair protein RecO [Thermodesulfovibrionales bacterium]|nr:DNA repair protein RecO [Thermodesulfovibrionales bacterium]